MQLPEQNLAVITPDNYLLALGIDNRRVGRNSLSIHRCNCLDTLNWIVQHVHAAHADAAAILFKAYRRDIRTDLHPILFLLLVQMAHVSEP